MHIFWQSLSDLRITKLENQKVTSKTYMYWLRYKEINEWIRIWTWGAFHKKNNRQIICIRDKRLNKCVCQSFAE
jgi:hypothetical protein